MAARKAPAKKAATKKASAKPAKKPAPKGALVISKKAKPAPAPKPAPAKKAARPKRDPALGPVQKTRVVVPMDVYEAEKDDIKSPFKAHEMKWNFLGEGKGLYKRADNGVHCFVQFKDDGVHYSLWGDDKPRVAEILAAWRKLLGEEAWAKATSSGEEAASAEKAEVVSEALKLWRLAQPQRRPGEPDLFYQKRLAEWQAKRPT